MTQGEDGALLLCIATHSLLCKCRARPWRGLIARHRRDICSWRHHSAVGQCSSVVIPAPCVHNGPPSLTAPSLGCRWNSRSGAPRERFGSFALATLASAPCRPDRAAKDNYQKFLEGRGHCLRAKRHTPTVAELLRPRVLLLRLSLRAVQVQTCSG